MAFLSQVLQRRHNHDTFWLHRVSAEDRPDLIDRFHVEGRRVVARIVAPRGCAELERGLVRWLK